jgi:cellulose 1,4-beta-cellobiosidase
MRFTAAGLSRRARLGILLTAVLAAGSGTAIFTATAANAATGCSVSYTITNQWPGGFGAAVNITNLGDPITSWTLGWTYANGQTVTQLWNGSVSQSGANVTVTNLSYNGSIGTGVTYTGMGFNGSWNNSTNSVPSSFTLNGTTCTGGVSTGPSPTASPTRTTSPTASPTTSPTRTTSPTTSPTRTTSPTTSPTPTQTNCTSCPHVDNAYAGAKMYVNPDWAAKANSESGGSRISNQPTGVWLDTMAAITAPAGSGYTTSLTGHLDNALSQGATAIQFVIYDLPGRDCAALASNGEIPPDGIDTYEHSYIDPIATILSNSKYANLRIILIIEIDSLPNLITNVSGNTATSNCATMQQNGNYVTGIQYALSKFHAISNVYNYVDAAHSGWLGWDTNFQPAINLFASTAQGATGGKATVDGFIADTANYTPTTEPFINPTMQIGGQQENSVTFYSSNPFVDELRYAQAFYTKAVAAGFSPNIGMLIDTSRNGWGGPNRPTAASTSTDVNTFVNASKIDKRPARGDWCNQSGAGLGARPQANPATNIDAYVWIKPPGESDGSSSLIPTGPNNPGGKGFDQMCDPTYGGNARNNNSPTGALPNSPVSGAWFSAQFQQLMTNAFPAL